MKLVVFTSFFVSALAAILFFSVNLPAEKPKVIYTHNSGMALENCPTIDLNSLEKLAAFQNRKEFDCLAQHLKITFPLALSPGTVRFLSEKINAGIGESQNRAFFESEAAIVSASIVSAWASWTQGRENEIKFDYRKYRSWLIDVANLHNATSSYAVGPIMRFGPLVDQESLLRQFDQFDETGKVTIFVELSLRCDKAAMELLEQLKRGNAEWWRTRPDLNKHKCIT